MFASAPSCLTLRDADEQLDCPSKADLNDIRAEDDDLVNFDLSDSILIFTFTNHQAPRTRYLA
jgi:hypothetical protein